jgi:hypothetical protein
MPTPKRPRVQDQSGAIDSSPTLPSWVELIPSRDAVELRLFVLLQKIPRPVGRARICNFEVLRAALPKMDATMSASLAELREHFERLANAMQKVDRRLGHPEGFGMLASVTTAFDGLRYLAMKLAKNATGSSWSTIRT